VGFYHGLRGGAAMAHNTGHVNAGGLA
jgi:hypothetical protein